MVFHEPFGVNKMIWFLMFFSGQLRKHTKLFGTPYLTMIDLSDNGLLRMGKTLDFAYDDVLKEFSNVWCVKGLIVTRSNSVVTWKVRPWIALFLKSHCLLCSTQGGC